MTMQGPNSLTVRDAEGKVIATPAVGSKAAMWADRTGTVRSFRESILGGWIASEEERLAREGGREAVRAFLDATVSVTNDYSY